MEDKDFKKLFTAHKLDIPDKGFSERVIRRLPERKSILPQIVMVVFIMIGLALTLVIQGITHLIEQINSLFISISRLQAPSPSSVIIYLVTLTIIGIIGYSITQADAG